MLTQAIGELLPSAIGVALSPLPIVAVILMLGTERARRNGPAFAIGWIAGLVIVSVIVLLVAGDADNPDSTTSTSINWLQVGVGVLFIAMAGRTWRSRPKHGEETEMPKWLTTVDAFTPAKSLVLGVGCQPSTRRTSPSPLRQAHPSRKLGSAAARASPPSPCSS